MTRARPRFAVIGTGAAALGVLDALLSHVGEAKITVFDISDRPKPEPGPDTAPRRFYDGVYITMRNARIRGFPPPKTHFGTPLPGHSGTPGLVESRAFGGLTNFWGATMLPFTDAELNPWPIRGPALAPHYARIAAITGISGQSDDLDAYFSNGHVNRPPIAVTPTFARLSSTLKDETFGYRILSGTNRCAIETRADQPRACTACGECLAGCYRDAIYSARHSMTQMLGDKRVTHVQGEVMHLDPNGRTLSVRENAITTRLGDFDRIFLAAGCLGTTAILLRSAGVERSKPLLTNSVHVFPILNFGRGDGGKSEHIALANLILACVPDDPNLPTAQAQLYPNADYLWRPQVPPGLWPALRGLVRASRSRLIWGRLFVHSDLSQTNHVSLKNDYLSVSEDRAPDRSEPARVLKSLKCAASGGGFRVLTRPTILQRSSVHYGGTFPYGNDILPIRSTGEVFPGVHVCDSTVFPEMPAVSPTFTIMANARRTAMEALDA